MALNVSIILVHSIQPNNSQSAFISNKCCPALCANSSLLFGGGISERRIGIRKAGFFQSCGRFNGDENSKALKRTSCVCVIRHVRGKLERNEKGFRFSVLEEKGICFWSTRERLKQETRKRRGKVRLPERSWPATECWHSGILVNCWNWETFCR